MGQPAGKIDDSPKGLFRKGYDPRRYTGGRRPSPAGLMEVKRLAREFTEDAIATLGRLMGSSKDDRVRVKCAEVLLDRAWGRPTQMVAADPDPRAQQQAGFELLVTLQKLAGEEPTGVVIPSQSGEDDDDEDPDDGTARDG